MFSLAARCVFGTVVVILELLASHLYLFKLYLLLMKNVPQTLNVLSQKNKVFRTDEVHYILQMINKQNIRVIRRIWTNQFLKLNTRFEAHVCSSGPRGPV